VTGTASGGSISFQAETLAFTGTYSSTQINATSSIVVEGITVSWTFRQTKQ
jgi:hypothetical protein